MMSAALLEQLRAAKEAWENGFGIIVQRLMEALDLSELSLQLDAAPPVEGLTLTACRRRLLNAIDGLRLFDFDLPDRSQIRPWAIGQFCLGDFDDTDYELERALAMVHEAVKELPQRLADVVADTKAYATQWRDWFARLGCALRGKAPRVAVNLPCNQLTIDGTPHPVQPHLAQMANALIEAAATGEWWVTGPQMNDLPGCKGKKITREIGKLRAIPGLDTLIRSESPKGYRLTEQ
jgi:hypothetical protein